MPLPDAPPGAYARFLRHVAVGLNQLADDLDATPKPATPRSTDDGLPGGKRQREVFALDGIKKKAGVGAAQIVDATGMRQPNVYKVMTDLVAGGWVEVVEGVEPTHWRTAKVGRSA